MADFCKQCSILPYGEDFRELALPLESEARGERMHFGAAAHIVTGKPNK